MVAKKARKASKRVKDLSAKGLTTKQAKKVKGGFVVIGGTPNPGNVTSPGLLPAVQQKGR